MPKLQERAVCRYAQIGEALLDAAKLLGDIDEQQIPQKLLRNLTVAAMKMSKHRALISMAPEDNNCAHLAMTLHVAKSMIRRPTWFPRLSNNIPKCLDKQWYDEDLPGKVLLPV